MTDDGEVAAVRQRNAEFTAKWRALSEREEAIWAEQRALMAEWDRLPRIVDGRLKPKVIHHAS